VPTIPFLLPREDRFFLLMKESARNIHETARLLVDLMEDYVDVAEKVARIRELEEVGDHVIHEIMKNLHRTFVTPLDREDIAALAERLDDVVDAIEEAARDMSEYGIERPTDRAREMARIILKATEVVDRAVGKLTLRGPRLREILPDTVEINRLENEADHVISRAVGELFRNSHDAIEVIKWREIYSLLETATDRCEDVANVLEGVVLKNA
jgi:predicted phosphate transport protein (TIGR00153 family)